MRYDADILMQSSKAIVFYADKLASKASLMEGLPEELFPGLQKEHIHVASAEKKKPHMEPPIKVSPSDIAKALGQPISKGSTIDEIIDCESPVYITWRLNWQGSKGGKHNKRELLGVFDEYSEASFAVTGKSGASMRRYDDIESAFGGEKKLLANLRRQVSERIQMHMKEKHISSPLTDYQPSNKRVKHTAFTGSNTVRALDFSQATEVSDISSTGTTSNTNREAMQMETCENWTAPGCTPREVELLYADCPPQKLEELKRHLLSDQGGGHDSAHVCLEIRWKR